MAVVGIIANPASGKDIRRLVAQGRVVPNHEKVNILRRVLQGLDAVGVDEVVIMPDAASLGGQALQGMELSLTVRLLDLPVFYDEDDSRRAAEVMQELGVRCLVTLGGDGTNRVVAKGAGQVPIVPISTGTNNVFPVLIEGTVAGVAAGIVAQGLVGQNNIYSQRKRLEVYVDGVLQDIALIDVAVSTERFVGARAIWDISTMSELLLTSASPNSIGLSSIGGWIRPVSVEEPVGLHLRFGNGNFHVRAPVAPGIVQEVPIDDWNVIAIDEPRIPQRKPCVIALDGERQFPVTIHQDLVIALSRNGPRVVEIEKVLQIASNAGVFIV